MIYWKEQCEYCVGRSKCIYKEKVGNYINELGKVNDEGVYGGLHWWCDYFLPDRKKYYENNLEQGDF